MGVLNKEYVNVELDRYEDLIISEEQLRTIFNLIFHNVRYSEFQDDLVVEDEKRQIISYLKNCVTGIEYRNYLNEARDKYKSRNEEQ